MRKLMAGVSVFMLLLPMIALTGCNHRDKTLEYVVHAEYFDEERRLEGEMQVLVPNRTENTLSEIPFLLYANSFSENSTGKPVSELYAPSVFYDGASYGGMEIQEVTGGKAWRTSEDGNFLLVSLDEELYPDESATLSVRYTLTLPKADYRFGVGEHCVNLSCFYPQVPAENESGFICNAPAPYGDPFVFDNSDFEIELKVPEGMIAACAGETEEVTNSGKTTYHVMAKNVREMAFVLGNFEKSSVEQNGVQIDYYHFADESPEKTLQTAADALACFSELITDYPYKRFAFAETDLAFGGMEYSGFMTISSALEQKERDDAVAHETAHMWWHALVGSNEYASAWQDEGLAEYSVALFYENNPAYGRDYREEIAVSERAYRNYYSVKSQFSENVDTSMTKPLKDFTGDYEYRILAYDKGVILFDRLRGTMGDKKFFACLGKYAEKFAGKIAAEYDLISCFSSQEELILSFTEGRCFI